MRRHLLFEELKYHSSFIEITITGQFAPACSLGFTYVARDPTVDSAYTHFDLMALTYICVLVFPYLIEVPVTANIVC